MEGGIQGQLDSLAQNGILNFDSDAYVKGTSPRYTGELPKQYLPFCKPLGSFQSEPALLPGGTKLADQAHKDELVKKEGAGEEGENKSNWKKYLFGGVVATAILVGAYKIPKFRANLAKFFDPKENKTIDKLSKAKGNIKEKCSDVWTKITNVFKKKS